MKKQSPEWYIAATHWLTAMITNIVFGIVIWIPLALITQNKIVIFILVILSYQIVMWLAVKYSARYINKKYLIKNARQIVILSTVYLVIVGGGYRAYDFFQNGAVSIDSVGYLLSIITFYFASDRLVKNNSSQPTITA